MVPGNPETMKPWNHKSGVIRETFVMAMGSFVFKFVSLAVGSQGNWSGFLLLYLLQCIPDKIFG